MKRLVFCFDGTWNKLDPTLATNVVLTAASILRTDRHGVAQIIHYDEGVGTGEWDTFSGGVFGAGLIENVREAYRFLIFNYDLGDEIYVFGFSRGAYSARTFVGFIRHVGPGRRLNVGRIDEALALYERRKQESDGSSEAMRQFRADYSSTVCIGTGDDDWRCKNVSGYVKGQAPEFRVKYVGVWDTVGALGVPAILPFSGRLNRNYRFHDPTVDAFIESARHAVALDERRKLFSPVVFGDLTALNAAQGFANDDPKAPYQERWFPGVHGSVGGGGDIRGLSDAALAWILQGAKRAGLQLDTAYGTRIHGFNPDPLAPLVNASNPSFSATALIKGDRTGPDHPWHLSPNAIRRWRTPAGQLGGQPYRPGSLRKLAMQLDALGPLDFVPPIDLITVETVQPGDTLSGYAKRHYGDTQQWRKIAEANQDVVDDPSEIFVGQKIRIPKL